MRVGVLDHGMGNLRSVAKALEAAGAAVTVSNERDGLTEQDALCVPGQGVFGRCMSGLVERELGGFVASWIGDDRPFLGICLGMQVLFDHSDEAGGEDGLGILPGRVARLPSDVRVPHIGWNLVNGRHYYFDHSYAVYPADESGVTGWCDHGGRFAALIERGPITAMQFHPEKSSAAGLELLRGWVKRA